MKKNNSGMIKCAVMMLIGVGASIAAYCGIGSETLYSFGIAMILMGMLRTMKQVRYHKDKTYQEQMDIERQDERNKFLSMKAWSWSGYLFVVGAGFVTIAGMLLKQTLVMQVASWCVCIMVLLYWICYIVLRKKY